MQNNNFCAFQPLIDALNFLNTELQDESFDCFDSSDLLLKGELSYEEYLMHRVRYPLNKLVTYLQSE